MLFVDTVRIESARFVDALTSTAPDASVPCCPDWRAADLLWHLTEVQHFWGSIVEGLLSDPGDVPELERPTDAELGALFVDRSERLVRALTGADPYDECWSWDEHGGGSVAWVSRRQAHEALIHRVDAEQAAGRELSDIPVDIAADGVDEALGVQMSGIPDWAEFVPSGGTMELYLRDADRAHRLEIGRMVGTSLASGRHYDLAVIELRDAVTEPSTIVAADAKDLYLWLWGRGSDQSFVVDGDQVLVGTLRAIAADSMG